MYALGERIKIENVIAKGFFDLNFRTKVLRFFSYMHYLSGLLPKYLGVYAFFVLMFSVLTYGIFCGGHASSVLGQIAKGLNFSIKKIEISGAEHTSKEDVLFTLHLDTHTSLIDLDIDAARAHLLTLPWVKSVEILKEYPDRLFISLVERKPYAIWQHNGEFDVIDQDGICIEKYRKDYAQTFEKMPLVLGENANLEIQNFIFHFQKLKGNPYENFAKQVKAYFWIGDRRWDLLLENGLRLKLPEQDPLGRLMTFLEDKEQRALLKRDLTAIDLRIEDRITITLSDAAYARQEKTAKILERLRIKRESKIKGGLL